MLKTPERRSAPRLPPAKGRHDRQPRPDSEVEEESRWLAIDIRTDGGYEMIPNSETSEGRYEWLTSGAPPDCRAALRQRWLDSHRVRKQVQTAVEENCEGSFLLYRVQEHGKKLGPRRLWSVQDTEPASLLS